MTTLEKIRAEIRKVLDKERDFTSKNAKAQAIALNWVLELFDKYAEQEPTTRQSCENCKQDRKECGNDDHYGFCQNWEYAEQEPCDDAVSRQAVINLIRGCNSALEEPRIFVCHNAGVKFEQYVMGLPSVRPQEPEIVKYGWTKIPKCTTCKYWYSPIVPCSRCKDNSKFEPQESDEISERNMKMWQDIFEEEKRRSE